MRLSQQPLKFISSMQQVQSLVLFDLETSGLNPKYVRITELAAVAVTRANFLQCVEKFYGVVDECSGKLPRVTASLCLPVEPDVPIEPTAAKVSGLSDNMLKNCSAFPSAYKTLVSFLERLPRPICLVAHNGDSFDFRLLKNEIQRHDIVDFDFDWSSICTFDTMRMLPKIDKSFFALELKNPDVVAVGAALAATDMKTCATTSLEQICPDGIMSPSDDNGAKKAIANDQDEYFPHMPIIKYTMNGGAHDGEVWKTPPPKSATMTRPGPPDHLVPKEAVVKKLFVDAAAGGDDCPESSVVQCQNTNVLLTAIRNSSSSTSVGSTVSFARKLLQASGGPPTNGYGQAAVFERLFKRPIKNAHTALGDCEALLRIILCYGKDFLYWIDNESKPF